MADWFVWHAAGGDDSGQPDWANAAPDMITVDGAAAVGDTVYVASDHVESDNFSKVIGFVNGTLADPVRVISADRTTGSPPTTYESMVDEGTGIIETTGAADDITLTGAAIYHGINFACDDRFTETASASQTTFVDCRFTVPNDNFASNGGEGITTFIDCVFALGSAFLVGAEHSVFIIGGDISAVAAAGFFTGTGNNERIVVEDCDLTAEDTLVSSFTGNRSHYIFRRCQLNAGTLATPITGAINNPLSWILIESSQDGNNTVPVLGMQYFEGFWGKIEIETTEFRTGGASDGETPYSWKMTCNANTVSRHTCLRSPPITAWKDAGSETLAVYVAHDAVGDGTAGDLQDDECWLEVSSPDETANPNTTSLGKFQTTLPATVLTAAADLTNEGSDEWQSTPTTYQQITATIAPAEAGPITVRVCLATGASSVVFVDPKLHIA